MLNSTDRPVRILFDVSRLAWRSRRGAPTGIDRVIAAYGRWLDAEPGIEAIPVVLAGDDPVTVSTAVFRRLISPRSVEHDDNWETLSLALSTAGAPPVRRPATAQPIRDLIHVSLSTAVWTVRRWFMPTPHGDIYLNVAHSGLHRPPVLKKLAGRGVRPVVMVHDLIPITHPEFCTPQSKAKHLARIDSILTHADTVLTNSVATAESLKAYAEGLGRSAPTTIAAPLGVESAFSARAWAPSEQPYFVFVGTLEARKNLAFLLTVWRRLAETMGEAAPRLVLAGRRGWENESVIDHLDRSSAVRALVHEVADLSDDSLAALMAGSRAVLAPSLAEGFDLPVMEALSLGVPAIASDIPAHRELAEGAQLVDPLNGPAWAEAIRAACGVLPARNDRNGVAWPQHFATVKPVLVGLAG